MDGRIKNIPRAMQLIKEDCQNDAATITVAAEVGKLLASVHALADVVEILANHIVEQDRRANEA